MHKLLKFLPILLFTVISCSTSNHSVKLPIKDAAVEVKETKVVEKLELKVEDLDLGFSIQIGQPKFSPETVKRSIAMTYIIWEEAFGDEKEELKNAINYLVVVWKPSSWTINGTIFSVNGDKVDHSSVIGLATTPFVIEVSAGNDKVCQSSLVHELVHLFLWHENGTPDADHEGDKYKGWTKQHTEFIKNTNELLCILE